MLVHFGIRPYLVFDGDYLPSKAATEQDRAARRTQARNTGLELLKLGKTSQAQQELQKAVDVTPEMARMLIEELKKAGVQYVVAPYEADSQLAYLERKGIIDGIVSEDSDLLVFGARVLLTKLDQYGECVMIRRDDFTACREVALHGFSDVEFRRMAILSGCDYLTNIKSMGLKTAHGLVRRYKSMDRLLQALRFDGKFSVPRGYLEEFENAERTFLYQWVFCPMEQKLVNCTEVPEDVSPESLPFIGQCVDTQIAIGVSRGDLHPHTKQRIALLETPRETPRTSLSRTVGKENALQTPDGKKPVTIDTFFKAKRAPLAELDPNCFTLSPSQQQLLEHQRNSGAWSASPAPSVDPRPPLQPRVYRNSLPATVSQPARRVFSDSTARHSSAPHPAKRMRLCSEGTFEDSPLPSERSKFFKSPERSASSPIKGGQSSTSEFNLFSDDSVEDAMAELPDPSTATSLDVSLYGFAMPTKQQVAVFEDGTHVLGKTIKDESQESNTTRGYRDTDESQSAEPSPTPATSVAASQEEASSKAEDPQDMASTFDAYLSKEIHDLRDKFSYKAKTSPSKLAGRRRSSPSKLKVFAEAHPMVNQVPATDDQPLNQKSPGILPVADDEPDIEDLAWQRAADTVIVAESPSAKHAYALPELGVAAAVQAKGSEDLLLVPNSEDECTSLSDEDSAHVVPASPDDEPRRLNLGRFAFAG